MAERDPAQQLVIDDTAWIVQHLKDAAEHETTAAEGSKDVQKLDPDTPVLRGGANPNGWLLEDLLPVLIAWNAERIDAGRAANGGEPDRREPHWQWVAYGLTHANAFQQRAAPNVQALPKAG